MLDFLKSITIEDIAITLAFVAGVIGSIAAIWKFYGSFRERRRERERAEMQAIVEAALNPYVERLEATEQRLESGLQGLGQNNLQTARLDLMAAIEHTPGEHEAILKLATDYFLKLHGDAWMSGVFRKWSEDEGVDISYIAAQVPHLKG